MFRAEEKPSHLTSICHTAGTHSFFNVSYSFLLSPKKLFQTAKWWVPWFSFLPSKIIFSQNQCSLSLPWLLCSMRFDRAMTRDDYRTVLLLCWNTFVALLSQGKPNTSQNWEKCKSASRSLTPHDKRNWAW